MAYIGQKPAEKYVSLSVQHFTVTATDSYALTTSITSANELALYINNVRQEPGAGYAYTAVDTTLTLSAATAATDTMYCVYLGKAVGTINPPTGSVSSASIVDGTIVSGDIESTFLATLTATKSPEVYGFSVNANGQLIVTTTNSGADSITGTTYATFDDVVFAVSGFTWSTSGTDLIATI